MIYIYILIDPKTNEIRYIGQTIQKFSKRLQGHIHTHKNDTRHVTNWIRSLKEKELKPLMVEIDRIEDEDIEVEQSDADEAEIIYIREYRLLGCPLTNCSDGGKKRCIVSPETREKIGAGNKGKIITEEQKARIAKAVKEVWKIPGYRENQSTIRKGIPMPEETKQRIGKANKGKKKPEGFGTALSLRQKGRKLSEEHIYNLSDTWKITSPKGEVMIIKNLKSFCISRGLSQGNMALVATGQRKQHKQWKCEKVNEKENKQ